MTLTIKTNQTESENVFGDQFNSPVSQATAQPVGPVSSTEADKQFVAETVAEFGPTIRNLASGKTELNHLTMAHILARRLGLAYDVLAKEFLQRRSDQTYGPVAMDLVTHQVAVVLQQIAASHPVAFSMKELRPSRVKLLVDAIKVAAAQVGPDARDVLLLFVRETLCLKPGSSVTGEEIRQSYIRFAHKHRQPKYPRQVFHQKLARMVFELFTIPRANDVLRKVEGTARSTSRRGFHGLAFKTDGPDDPDGTLSTEDSPNPS